MMFRVDRLLFVILLLGTAFAVPSAHAAAPYQGLYVIMNPYAPGDINNLQTAAQTPCKAGQQSSVTPFCTSANGVFLRFPWCDFELYHLSNAKNQPYPSCHYIVSYSNGAGSKGTQTTIGDRVSPCAGTYDTCSGSNQSVLATSVRYVTQINTQRAAIGLPPLKLSIGMYAGIGTPQTIFDTLGYVDVPNNNTPSNNPDVTTCYRLPLPWAAQFLTSYLAAMDQLLAYIPTQMPAGANIAIVKVSGITGSDAEIQMPGANQIWATPTDPGPATRGPLLSCNPNLTGAQLWLNAYNALPIAGRNLSQADESATGTMIGHIWGTLLNDKLSTALISIPTTDGDAYPYVACGTTGTSTCQTSFVSGPWSVYYFEYYMHDLFNGGLAYSAAAAAYATVRKDTYSLPVSAVSVNATDLSTQTINTANAEPCVVNNVLPVDDLVDTLNNVKTSVPGVGTVIGWQTSIDQSVYCSSNSYLKILTGGIDQGSLFEEVEEDAAFANLGSCGQYLTQALKDILALSPPTTCVY